MLTGCHRDPQNPETLIRLDFAEPFPAGTAFAIARQSYPNSTYKRIRTINRLLIEKQIRSALQQHNFIHDPDAKLLINFYRDFWSPKQSTQQHVTVDVLTPHTRLKYHYDRSGIDPKLANPRDGALVIDIIDIEKRALLRQLVVPYYFGVLQQALRASADREDKDYIPPINLIGSQLGLK